jgi:predicted deacetylase
MRDRKLIVSVHDVTPKYKGELTEIVSELDRVGVNKRSVLVVPNWEGEYDLRQDDNFVSWLHGLKASGDEIVLHGYNHQSTKRKGHYKNPFQWFMGEVFAQGTGEFQNLTYEETRQKLQDGKRVFSDVELDGVVGFVAPAWLTNNDIEKALKDEDFQYHIFTTFMNYVGQLSKIPIRNIQTGETVKSREVAFDGSRSLIDYGTKGLAWLVTRNKRASTTRIAIHPQDIHNARPFDYALKLIEEAKEGRDIATYRELF